MAAAVYRVDVVGEAEDCFGVAVVVLHCDVNLNVVAIGFHADRLFVHHDFALVQMLDEFGDAAGIAKLGALGITCLRVDCSLVGKGDLQALVEKCEFPEPLGEGVVVIFSDGKDCPVGRKCTFVPRRLLIPICRSVEVGSPQE